jgi:GTP cyclohydrolase II
MFSYVDPSVKRDLLRDGKLIFLDDKGRACEERPGQVGPSISLVGPVPLPVGICQGEPRFRWYAWVKHSDLHRIENVVEQVRVDGPRMLFALVSEYMAVNSVLLYGDFDKAEAPLVRVHSNCLTGDVFGSMRCDCGPQLQQALDRIRQEGVGALVYMAGHEGRGIGLWAKAITYLLQDAGQDTYQANEKLGLPADSRDFRDAGLVVRHFRGGKDNIRLLGNNPMKREAMEAVGLRVTQEPQVVGLTRFNVRYLTSKREKGHIIPAEALSRIRPACAADDEG